MTEPMDVATRGESQDHRIKKKKVLRTSEETSIGTIQDKYFFPEKRENEKHEIFFPRARNELAGKSGLASVDPFIDGEGVIRVGSKLVQIETVIIGESEEEEETETESMETSTIDDEDRAPNRRRDRKDKDKDDKDRYEAIREEDRRCRR